MIAIILAILIGFLAGMLTGLIPGIHINLLAAIIISLLPVLLSHLSPLPIIIFITAMSITHIFLDAIPSSFLGAPESSVLAVMPAHKLLLKGQGYDAIRLLSIGSFLGIISIILLSPFLYTGTKILYPIIQNYIAYILIFAAIILILKESKSIFYALMLFSLSGILGITVLTMPALKQPLLPLLSGLFGSSMLLLSINNKISLPLQTASQTSIDKKEISKAIFPSIIASILTGFLPGISSSESAILATSFFKRIKLRTYLMLLGAINSMIMLISFIAVVSIERARSGSVAAIQNIIQDLSIYHLALFLAITLIISFPALLTTLYLGKRISSLITRINYTKLCLSILLFLAILVTIISGPLGLIIMLVATSLGILPALLKVRHSHLMGCLILPVILFLLL